MQENHLQDPQKRFGLPESLHGGLIRGHALGGDYARLVSLLLYNPALNRGGGWLHQQQQKKSSSSSIYYFHVI